MAAAGKAAKPNTDALETARKEIEGEMKALQEGLSLKKTVWDGEVAAHKMSKEQELTSLMQATEKEYQAELALLEKEKNLQGQKPAAVQEINKSSSLQIHAREQQAAHSAAEDAIFDAKTHEQIDAHFTPAFGPEDEEKFNNFAEMLRPCRLSDAEQAARDLACQAAQDDLARQEAEIAEVEQRTGYREIEARKDAAYDAVLDAEYNVMEAKPSTPVGAVALLRFVAGLIEVFYLPGDDEHEG